jgi:hypothetical protein
LVGGSGTDSLDGGAGNDQCTEGESTQACEITRPTEPTLVVVDSSGDVGKWSSIALDAAENPVIAYYDVTHVATKVAHCNDLLCGGGDESIQTLDRQVTVSRMVLDASGNPVIVGRMVSALGVVHCNDPYCSGHDEPAWVFYPLEGSFPSVALDSLGYPVISYRGDGALDLMVSHCTDPDCRGDEVVNAVDTAGVVGSHTSLVLDASDYPVIAYYDETNADLKVVHCNDVNCSGGNESIATVDAVGGVGTYNSLALDAFGYPVISYYDETNGDLKVVHCGNANCTSGNVIQTVDSLGTVGLYTSLALTSSGNPVVSYYDAANGDLKLALCGNANCTSGNIIQTVDGAGSVGYYTSLAIGPSGSLFISYYDGTNGNLKLAILAG